MNRKLLMALIIVCLAVLPVFGYDLKNEKIAGIGIGDNVSLAIKRLGRPESKSAKKCGPGPGMDAPTVCGQTFKWPSLGIDIETVDGEVINIRAYKPSKKGTAISTGSPIIKTSGGILIGSSRDEVKRVYGVPESEEKNKLIFSSGEESIGEDEGCQIAYTIELTFINNRVSQIVLPYGGGCE